MSRMSALSITYPFKFFKSITPKGKILPLAVIQVARRPHGRHHVSVPEAPCSIVTNPLLKIVNSYAQVPIKIHLHLITHDKSNEAGKTTT